MSVDSVSNTSLLPMDCSSNTSLHPAFYLCFQTSFNVPAFTTFTTVSFLTVPLSITILWMGFSRCWNGGKEPLSHFDVFVYNLAVTETFINVGYVLICVSIHTCIMSLRTAGYYIFSTFYPAQTFFHCLTCLERYVAVVHPIAYLSLKKCIWVRHLSCLTVWVLSLVLLLVSIIMFPHFPGVVFFVVLILTSAVGTFCTFAVFQFLLKSGLKKFGGKGIDQSKLRAYHHILLITVTLVLRSIGLLIYNTILMVGEGQQHLGCLVLVAASLLCLPSDFLVPLQYLHRAGVFAHFSRRTGPSDR